MGIWIFACDGCLPLLLPQPFHELCERPFGRPVGTVAIGLTSRQSVYLQVYALFEALCGALAVPGGTGRECFASSNNKLSSLHVFFSQKSECPSHVGLVAAMKQRIGAMFSRVPGSVPALGAGAAIGGFVLDAWKRRQEEQDRARMVNRVIHSSFHAFQPKVEIPREQVQARCHAQVVSIRVALSFTLLC